MIKKTLKLLIFLLGLLISLPLIFLTKIEEWLFGSDCERVFSGCKEILAGIPTIIGETLRKSYYWAVCSDISPHALFMYQSMVAHRTTSIGANTVIGVGTIIGHAIIGKNVLIAARVSILSGKYQHGIPEERSQNFEIPTGRFTAIGIGDYSWIGEGAIVMADIAKGCTIAANAVVYNPTQQGGTYIGNPARKVNLK